MYKLRHRGTPSSDISQPLKHLRKVAPALPHAELDAVYTGMLQITRHPGVPVLHLYGALVIAFCPMRTHLHLQGVGLAFLYLILSAIVLRNGAALSDD